MTVADEAARYGLHQVGGRPPLGKYLADVWRRREFIVSLAKFRIEAENGRNRLGMAWVVLKPLLSAGMYGLIFGILLQTRGEIDDFVAYLIIGVMMFEYFSTSFSTGAKSITSNASLVQSLSFPRMSLPLALVVQRFLQFMPMVVMMMIAAVAKGNGPELTWLLMLPLIAIFTLFNAGLTLITARMTVHFRDLTQLLPFIARFFFYTSGIFFSVEHRFGDHPTIMRIADFQPIHNYLTLARAILLDGPQYTMPTSYWLHGTCWAIGILIVGCLFFWSAEERYGRTD